MAGWAWGPPAHSFMPNGSLAGERKTQWNWLVNGLMGLIDMMQAFEAEAGRPELTSDQRQSIRTASANLAALGEDKCPSPR